MSTSTLSMSSNTHVYMYGTAERQLDARMRVASWPTTGGPAESVQTGAGTHDRHGYLPTDTNRTVFKINYCSPSNTLYCIFILV